MGTLLVRDSQLWVVGGLGRDYKVRTSTFVLDAATMCWSEGPSLRQGRKGAFGFVYGGRLYISGGAGNGLKHLDTTEVLDEEKARHLETIQRRANQGNDRDG